MLSLMKLFCIGCGPGDPDLLTVRAADLIKSADMVFAPTAREGKSSIALSVVEKYISKFARTVSLVFPMVKDKESRTTGRETLTKLQVQLELAKRSYISQWEIPRFTAPGYTSSGN
jgi:precorrin-2 methylase